MYTFKLFHNQCLKITEHGFHETPNRYPNLSATLLIDQQKFG